MAKIAIIGSSYSECLYSVENEPDYTDWSTEKRLRWAENQWRMAHILQQHEGHWVQLLEERYPQHEFHIFAKGGAGWEYSEITLHKVAELKFDRIIIELQDPRLMLTDSTVQIARVNEHRHSPQHVCFFGAKGQVIKTVADIAEEISKTVAWQSARGNRFAGQSINDTFDEGTSPHNPNQGLVLTDEVINYLATYIAGPIYATRYQQFLLSLKNVWPKVFDKVGVWAYVPINMPWSDLDLHAEIFGDELKIFEDVVLEKWIRKDPINNSIDTWKSKYYGIDRNHANKEGMKLIVDFLLKQPSIQKVLE